MKKLLLIALTSLFFCQLQAQSYVEIGTGVVTATMPIYSSWNYTWSSLIYKQADLGTAKTITKIALNCTNGPKTVSTQRMYFKLTGNTTFGSAAYESPTTNGYALVLNDTTLTFQNGWNIITLSTPFAYDGVQNLILHWEDRWGNVYGPNFTSTTSAINDNKNCGSDASFPTTNGNLNPYPNSLTNIRFYYNSTGPVTPSNPNPVDNAIRASVSAPVTFTLGANTLNYDVYFSTDSNLVSNLNASVKVVNNGTAILGTNAYQPASLLAQNTLYYWKVIAKSGSLTEPSPLWKFKTQKVISQFPWSYGFEDSTCFYPGFYGDLSKIDWTYAATPLNWTTGSQTNAHSGNVCANINITSLGSYSLISPRFNLASNKRITFWWKNADALAKIASYDTTYFEISTNGGSSWVVLDTLSPIAANTQYQLRTHNLNTYTSNNFYFRFRYNLAVASGSKPVFVDDITIEDIPSGAIINLSANQINFKELYVNGMTKKKITISNTGTANLIISGVSVSAPFSCSYTGTILPGQSDTATIIFTATAAGTFNPSLTFNTNSASGTNSVPCSGTVLSCLGSLYETFESVAVDSIPLHWNKIKSADPYQTLNNIGVKSSSFDAHSVPNVAKMYNNTDSISPLLFILPGVTNFNTDTLTFWASKTWGNTAVVKILIGLMNDPYDASSFAPVDTVTLADSMELHTVVFNTSNTIPYIAFKHGQVKPSSSIWIDDVSWQSASPTPPNPAAIVSPLNNSINNILLPQLKWTSTGGTPTGYKLFLGTNNPPTNLINNQDLGNVSLYQLINTLSYSTDYYWKIVPYNSYGTALNCPVWKFTTMADPTIYNFPWTEGFEGVTPTSGNDYPLGWTIQNGNEQSFTWDIVQNNPNYPNNAHSGQKAMHCMFSFLNPMNDWLFTPPLHLISGTTYEISFWYKTEIYISGTDTTSEKFEVKLGTAQDSSSMNLLTFYQNTFLRQPNYVKFTTTYTPTSTNNLVIGFHSFSNPTQDLIFLDDVFVGYPTGVSENKKDDPFTMYPNPASNKLSINCDNKNNKEIQILDCMGKVVFSISTKDTMTQIDLNGFASGMYFVKITLNNQYYTKKLIVK